MALLRGMIDNVHKARLALLVASWSYKKISDSYYLSFFFILQPRLFIDARKFQKRDFTARLRARVDFFASRHLVMKKFTLVMKFTNDEQIALFRTGKNYTDR